MNYFKKLKKNSMEELLLKEGERELLKTFGKIKVYAPDERFQVFIDEFSKEAYNQKKPNVQLEIDTDEVLLILLDLLTDFNELYPDLSELETFKEFMENKDRHPRHIKKMLKYVNLLGFDELVPTIKGIHALNELPEETQKILIEKTLERSGQ